MRITLSASLLALVAAVSMTGSAPSFASDPTAYVSEGGSCMLYDRNYNLVYGESWSFSEANGSYTASCKVKNQFGPGLSTKFVGFACYTDRGWANKTSEQIDSKGNATMTCQVKIN